MRSDTEKGCANSQRALLSAEHVARPRTNKSASHATSALIYRCLVKERGDMCSVSACSNGGTEGRASKILPRGTGPCA